MSFRTIGQCVLLILGGFCAFSCSVLEDRSDCPCILTLDARDVPSQIPEDAFPVLWHVSQGAFWKTGLLAREDCSAPIRIQVPRGGSQVYAVTGDDGVFNDGLDIGPGTGCPPIRLWTAYIDTRGEHAETGIRLRKEYCRLSILPVGSPATPPYRMVVEGNIDGYDAAGRPRKGPFRCEVDGGTVILPRQTDDSLLLHIYSANSDIPPAVTDHVSPGSPSAAPIRTFALGHAIAAAGYDWTASDLDDLTLELDFAATSLTLRTDNWTRTLPFEMVI